MTRRTVHHLGRAGEIPGGMTQVLNAYLARRFDRVDVAVLTTRGDPGDHLTAARLAGAAVIGVLRLPRRSSIVVAHLSERGSFVREGALLRLAHVRGVPTVAHLHGASFAAFAQRFPALVRFALGAADRVIVLSDESAAIAARFVPPERVHLVPNAIPAGSPVPKEDLVVFGGVVSHRKGVDVLLEAWVRADPPAGWRLVLAGPVREPDVLPQDLHGAEVLGAVPHATLMELLDRARAAVLPSRAEAMPVFVLEAMARSACVVATPVGGLPAVLADGRGLLVEPGDVDGLAAALRSVIADAPLRDATAAAAMAEFTARYAADAVFPILESVWLAAAERDGRGAEGTAPRPARLSS